MVVGAPRSGTTWIGQILGLAEDACEIHEPDNEMHDPFALRAKFGLGRFPVLTPDSPVPVEYEQLWSAALAGRGHRRAASWLGAKVLLRGASQEQLRAAFDDEDPSLCLRLRAVSRLASPRSWHQPRPQVVVKSVHAVLAVEWLAERYSPKVVVVLRHPLNVVASYLELGWLHAGLHANGLFRARDLAPWIPRLPADASPVTRMGWQIGLFGAVLREAAGRHPDWFVVSHEALCQDPEAGFQQLYVDLGLGWTPAAAEFLQVSNRPGKGIGTKRVTHEQPGRWRHRLTYAQVEEVLRALASFPVPSWDEVPAA